jgi:hypothetical protein
MRADRIFEWIHRDYLFLKQSGGLVMKSTVIGAVAFFVVVASSHNAFSQNNKKLQGLLNTPDYGGQKTFWVSRNQVTDTGDSKNQAIVLRITDYFGVLKGDFYRYAAPGSSSKKYKARKFGSGNNKVLRMIGTYDSDDPSSTRQRRVTFTLNGEYMKGGKKQLLRIKGSFYPGKNTDLATSHPDDSRVDDRVIMRIAYEGDMDLAPATAAPALGTMLKGKVDAATEQEILEKILEVSAPCDEQADDDVMEEETLEYEDTGDPDSPPEVEVLDEGP